MQHDIMMLPDRRDPSEIRSEVRKMDNSRHECQALHASLRLNGQPAIGLRVEAAWELEPSQESNVGIPKIVLK